MTTHTSRNRTRQWTEVWTWENPGEMSAHNHREGVPANLPEIYRGLLARFPSFRCGLIKVGSDFLSGGGGSRGYGNRKACTSRGC